MQTFKQFISENTFWKSSKEPKKGETVKYEGESVRVISYNPNNKTLSVKNDKTGKVNTLIWLNTGAAPKGKDSKYERVFT